MDIIITNTIDLSKCSPISLIDLWVNFQITSDQCNEELRSRGLIPTEVLDEWKKLGEDEDLHEPEPIWE